MALVRGVYDEATRDYTPFLVLPDAVALHAARAHDGTLARMRAAADAGEALLLDRWGTRSAAPPPLRAPLMRTVPLPPLPPPPTGAASAPLRSQRSLAAAWLHEHLWDRHRVEAPVFEYRGALYVRVSVGDATGAADFRRLADAVDAVRAG